MKINAWYSFKDLQYLIFPSLYISDIKQQAKQMLVYLVVLSADLMHPCFWNIQPSYIIITRVTQSAHVRYILYHKLLGFFLFVRGYGDEAPLTKCQPGLKSSCVRRGPQLLFHITSPTIYSKHSKGKMEMYQKSLLTEILAS